MAIPFCLLLLGGASFCAQTEPGSWQGHRAAAQWEVGTARSTPCPDCAKGFAQSEACVGDVQSTPRTMGKLTLFYCKIFNGERDERR